MKIAVFSTKSYDREYLEAANKRFGHEMVFLKLPLSSETCKLAIGFEAVCVFVNDQLDRQVLNCLVHHGLRLIALRCAGFNNVDVLAAAELGIPVVRVPAYSPHGVAEYAVGLMIELNRKIYRAYNRVREGNLSLEGMLGYELYGKTVGVIGTGKIGSCVARIMKGFGCKVLAYDPAPNPECAALGVNYVPLRELLALSDIVTLHLPLMRETRHLIDAGAVAEMKSGVMLINTSRGGLIDTQAVIDGLKSGKIGYLGLDVYEEEAHLFFEDLSNQVIQDDVFARLLTFPNVVVTGHQAFFTRTALANIAETTLANVSAFEKGGLDPANRVTPSLVQPKPAE